MRKKSYDSVGEVLYEDTLPNGLRVRVIPKKGFSSFYAALAVNYGGASRCFTADGKTWDTPAGAAHFLEHKMFDLPGGEDAMSIMTANGADPNAFTSADMTCYYFQCTRSFEENLRTLLHLVSTPYFTDETVQKEQGIIAQEISMVEDMPGSALYYNLLKLLYGHHPIREQIAGSVESIGTITPETLYECHRVFYSPGNAVLCVEGDVEAERVAAIAREEYTAAPVTAPAPDYGEDEGLLPVKTSVSTEMEVSAPQFLIGAKIAQDKEKPLRERIVGLLALRILCGQSSGFYSRLYAEGLLNRDYDCWTDYAAGTAVIMIGGESRDAERVLDELRKEVARTRESGFDEADFERAKRASVGARLRGLEDFESVCLSVAEGVFEGYDALSFIAEADTVTKRECEEFILSNLAPERLALSVITPKKV